MDEARSRPTGVVEAPVWVTADRQTEGRGRRGRDWTSPSGNLNATATFLVDVPSRRLPQLCFVAGVAMCEAIDCATPGVAIRLKWPNDILLEGGKLAGLLVESRITGDSAVATIGFGVNLMPVQRSDKEVSWLAGTDRERLLAALDGQLIAWLVKWREVGFEPVRDAWLRWGHPLGTPVAPSSRPCTTGLFAGLGDDGSLLMDTAEGRVVISSGELT